jgi:hypothetical protein
MSRRKPAKEQPTIWISSLPLLVIPISAIALLAFVIWLLGIHHDCIAKVPPPDADVGVASSPVGQCVGLPGKNGKIPVYAVPCLPAKNPAPSTADLLNHLEFTGHYRP